MTKRARSNRCEDDEILKVHRLLCISIEIEENTWKFGSSTGGQRGGLDVQLLNSLDDLFRLILARTLLRNGVEHSTDF